MWPIAVALTISVLSLTTALLIQACLAVGARSDPRVTERERYPVADSFSIQDSFSIRHVRPTVPYNPLAAFTAPGQRVDSHLG